VYAVDAIIQVEQSGTPHPKHYKCILAHTSDSGVNDPTTDVSSYGTPGTYWEQVDMGDEFGDSIQYSPWTDGKSAVLGNAGADPSRAVFSNGCWFDINVVINEEDFFRTWVDAKVIDDPTNGTDPQLDTLAARYAYDGTRATFPRGFRILVAGDNPDGDLTDYPDMIVERVALNSTGATTWRKLYTFFDSNNKAQVAVLDEGIVYEGDAFGTTATWSEIASAGAYGNDCFHPYTNPPTNADGIDLVQDPAAADYRTRSKVTDSTERPDITGGGGAFAQNQNSAIKFLTLAPRIESNVSADFTGGTSGWYKTAVGFNLRFPYPTTNDNSITENVGELYGGGSTNDVNSSTGLGPLWVTSYTYVAGDIVYHSQQRYICLIAHTSGTFATDKTALKWRLLVPGEPATFDIQNMNFTHDGQDGFNTINSASEDYGQISAVAMWLKFSIVETSGSTELDDEHRFRAWAIDTKDNVVYQDFVVRFSNNWEDIRLPVGSFRIYKGRTPLYGVDAAIAAFVPPKELEIINIFEWRNIKLFGVQYQSQYDKFGRFNPAAALVDEQGNSVTWSNINGATRTLWMDGFRFIKPLLVTSGAVTDRNLEPDFEQFPNITVYDQLVNAAQSQLEIEKFKHKEFNIETAGDEIFDVLFGESFYLKNTDIVSDADKSSEAGTIKLVAKRIEYSITKPPQGRGGLRRKINGSKVFT
jgi:hypothetical protein